MSAGGDWRAKVGLISDTHGYLDPAMAEVFRGVDRIVHAGDVGDEAVLKGLEKIAPVTVVKGNIDGGDLRFLPLEAMVEVGGVTIAALHIAGSPKRPKKQALDVIRRVRPDVLVVGHSHVPVVGKVLGALWINPGAAGRVGFHRERYAAILKVTTGGEIQMDRVHLGSRSARG